jgi:hypothetical protein
MEAFRGKKFLLCIEHAQTFFLSSLPEQYSVTTVVHIAFATYGGASHPEV